jgi:Domain of unknown function (DUF1707)
MTSPLFPTSLATHRERAIELLSIHFAHDRLSMDELDRRLERAYAATSVADLDALTADLPNTGSAVVASPRDAAPMLLEDAEEAGRIWALFSETRRGGLWAVPSQLEVRATMSNLTLDFRSALLAPGVTDVEVSAIMASVQILVPPGVRVVDRVRAFMASVIDDSYGVLSPDPSVPIIRLSGYAFMSEVKVRTKGRGS